MDSRCFIISSDIHAYVQRFDYLHYSEKQIIIWFCIFGWDMELLTLSEVEFRMGLF
jgi:hypothetical protein